MRRVTRLGGLLLAAVLLSVTFSTAASAGEVIFSPQNVISYKGCSLQLEFDDYNDFSAHPGYATRIIGKDHAIKNAKGCSLETKASYEYWDTKTKKNVTGLLSNVYPDSLPTDLYPFSGPAGSDGIRLRKTGSSATLCADYLDDCKTFLEIYTT